MCEEFNCETLEKERQLRRISYCSKGVFITLVNGLNLIGKRAILEIEDIRRYRCYHSTGKVDCHGNVLFNFEPFKNLNIGDEVVLKITVNGKSERFFYYCMDVCSIRIFIGLCNQSLMDFTCGERAYKSIIKIDNCVYKVSIENCKFTIKTNSIMYLIYRGVRYEMPIPYKNGGINPELVTELDLIEEGVFTATLVPATPTAGATIEILYNGESGAVSFFSNCGEIEKVCQ